LTLTPYRELASPIARHLDEWAILGSLHFQRGFGRIGIASIGLIARTSLLFVALRHSDDLISPSSDGDFMQEYVTASEALPARQSTYRHGMAL